MLEKFEGKTLISFLALPFPPMQTRDIFLSLPFPPFRFSPKFLSKYSVSGKGEDESYMHDYSRHEKSIDTSRI